jgi:hypothetical protein
MLYEQQPYLARSLKTWTGLALALLTLRSYRMWWYRVCVLYSCKDVDFQFLEIYYGCIQTHLELGEQTQTLVPFHDCSFLWASYYATRTSPSIPLGNILDPHECSPPSPTLVFVGPVPIGEVSGAADVRGARVYRTTHAD